ncbi:PLP-dependent aminotransferase family protein, partial [bacterium]|nr:PLP-dependent aminotransferase family protein [bacterium]
LTYRGALNIFNSKGVKVIGIPLDQDGMRVDMLETILSRHRVKMIYTIPTFQNPTGAVMSLERRKHLLALASRYQIPVVEDQFANELRLEGEDIPSLHSLDDNGNVIVVGSFSKILFHGIRLGWVVAPNKEFLSKLILAKKISDWQNNYLIQGAILEFCLEGYFDKYLKRKLKILKTRRDTMHQAAIDYFPEEMICNKPKGGLFSWVDMPKTTNAYELLMESKRKGVLFTPKRFFTVHSDIDNGMRLGYVSHEPEIIAEGMKILGGLLKQSLFNAPSSLVTDRSAAPVI